jgi:hypothetical protein
MEVAEMEMLVGGKNELQWPSGPNTKTVVCTPPDPNRVVMAAGFGAVAGSPGGPVGALVGGAAVGLGMYADQAATNCHIETHPTKIENQAYVSVGPQQTDPLQRLFQDLAPGNSSNGVSTNVRIP